MVWSTPATNQSPPCRRRRSATVPARSPSPGPGRRLARGSQVVIGGGPIGGSTWAPAGTGETTGGCGYPEAVHPAIATAQPARATAIPAASTGRTRPDLTGTPGPDLT